MKDHPILFSGPLVRAILSGQKTQTRRLLRQQPDPDTVAFDLDSDRWKSRSKLVRLGDTFPGATNPDRKGNWTDPVGIRCPYGQPGDRLWVREATRWSAALGGNDCEVEYRADNAKLRRTVVGESGYSSTRNWNLWTPSIYMPRWASRIDLEILEVRVQRVQEISEEDARAEGLPLNSIDPTETQHGWLTPAGYYGDESGDDCPECMCQWKGKRMVGVVYTAREALQLWWDHINGKRPGAKWEDNPWVWALTFKRVSS